MTYDPDYSPVAAHEDRTAPAVVYGLFLIAPATVVTVLLGVIVAYACRGGAGPAARSHFDFQIRTFWISIALWLIGGLMIVVGFPLSFVLIGLPILWSGCTIVALVTLWYAVRTIVGVVHLAKGRPYPRPDTWLV
jgi:uncharacterized membrane protein